MHNEAPVSETVTENPTRERVILEAIARRRRIAAVYNGVTHRLEPHLLFVRQDASHLMALNTEKSWRSDEAPRLGQFKTDGLSDLRILSESFRPLPGFDGRPPRDDDAPMLAVEAE